MEKVSCGICNKVVNREDAYTDSQYTFLCAKCYDEIGYPTECAISESPCIHMSDGISCDDCAIAKEWEGDIESDEDYDSVVMLQRLREREFGL